MRKWNFRRTQPSKLVKDAEVLADLLQSMVDCVDRAGGYRIDTRLYGRTLEVLDRHRVPPLENSGPRLDDLTRRVEALEGIRS